MKKIFMAGDSTMQYNDITTYPNTGWGQAFPLYLKTDWQIVNYARNGRSTKSFIDDGRLDWIDAEISQGDILIIQFGHNDNKPEDPARFTLPFGDYQENLKKYVEMAKKHGALPVLLTSICRRFFGDDGLVDTSNHGDYPRAMKELALALDVPCIDICAKSKALLDKLGEEKSRDLFMLIAPGEYPNYPDGKEDNTHLRYAGAVAMAGLAAEGLREIGGEYAMPLIDC